MASAKKTFFILIMAVLVLTPFTSKADTIPVDVQLSLLVDVSGSVSSKEFKLQMQGYADAFRDSDIISAIQNNSIGAIAVNMVFWSGKYEQSTAAQWSYIDGTASSYAFATALSEVKRPYSGMTSISGALEYATKLFALDDTYLATKNVIDISGDGTNNQDPRGTNLSKARADALAAGIIINGLPIGSQSLADYYEKSVIGGEDSFIVRASSFENFGEALQKKLAKEIHVPSEGAPEPGTMLLMISAIGALGAARMRRRRKT
ncbi:MAG: DUF1194 domain-containing protein [Desulfarculaceae bacterium]|nr:DUF1194 domain-containing protein [Desulfarculaceae bacterium]MCF8048367.1 DUF1194 domain-containing protein [Desulfarculaceae bacterium]MCF8066221.1 DUF1194 domain-containing protein [Desulfarculaceae bacterium]MCF8098454.1 DUF1194 domain-containing protein [Desulfarculaceae bacterium]MCF8123895.1 DUF1194 domain-containing protein [Desulfarculaceae bacterium]